VLPRPPPGGAISSFPWDIRDRLSGGVTSVHGENSGAYLLEIDPDITQLTPYADGVIRASASVGLPAVVAAFEQHRIPV